MTEETKGTPVAVNSAQPETGFTPGSGVWIPDAALEWVSAEVVSDNDGDANITVITEDGTEVAAPRAKVFLKNPEILEGSDDLAALSYMSEPHILHNLHSRYNLNMIYTYIGKILIAVNPYARIPLYGADMINAYYQKPIGALSPHVYAIAEDAFKDMRIEGASQSILVSGESGAGKTETTKYILQYFAAMGELLRQGAALPPDSKEETKTVSIEERVLESTPLLEAVGNAKTLRNDNSSRFGKFIEIHFNEFGQIIGAKIQTYLLEKSRIVRQVKGERNYHIFYQLLAGADDAMREELSLQTAEDYYYLSQSECTTVDEVDDAEVFERTVHAMKVSGMSKELLHDCWTIIAAILWIGNIKLVEKGEGSAVEDSTALENAARILKCNKDELEKSIVFKKVTTKNESFTIPLKPDQAENARDSLAMLLYSQLFEFLVAQINNALVTKKKPKSFIGILDIYGFECFEKNGFEQFCINFANEKLQQLFNLHVFKEEQQEYIKEKIDWNYVDFADNQDTLDLIEKKPMCILTLLDEESTFPKATKDTFANKLYAKLTQHARFEKPRFSNSAFTISHYAGKVTYDTEGFLEKNKDYIIPEQLAVLQKSDFPFMKTLIKAVVQAQGGQQSGTKFTSVGAQFATSLGVLMKTIMSTSPHYIRCIKPNPSKEPQLFIKKDVMHQLRCGGVMESVRICCAGFPTRRPLEKFYDRYKILAPRKKIKDIKQQVLGIVTALKLDEDKYKIGLTKIFLRSGQLASLEDYRTARLEESATMIQKHFRGMASRKYWLRIRRSAIQLQNVIRKVQAKKLLAGLRRNHAALRIQTCFRCYRKRKLYKNTRRLAVRLQLAIQAWQAKRQLSVYKHEAAALCLQSFMRACAARGKLFRRRRMVVVLQSRWRGKLARREYTKLRIEARSLATIQAAKNQLQAKLDEAQWRLQAERGAKAKLESEVEELRAASEAALTEKRRFEQERRAFEQQLREQDVKYSNEISEKNRVLEEQRARLDLELKAGKEEMQKLIERLRGENRELHSNLTQARETIEQLEADKVSSKKHQDELTAAFQKFKEDHREQIARMREAENDKNEEIDRLQATLQELKKETEEAAEYARHSQASMAEEISELRQQLADSTSGASAKGAEAEKLAGEIGSLAGDLDKLKETQAQLQASNAEYVATIAKLKASEADLDEQLKTLRATMAQEISARDAKVTALEAQLARKSQEGADQEEKVQKLKGNVSDLEKEVQKHLQEIARLNESARRDLEKARDDREYGESRLKGEVDTLKQEIYNLKDANLQLKQEKDSQVRSIEESYQRRLTERQEKISNLEDQISSLKEMKQRFEGDLSREKSQESAYFKEMSVLQETVLKKHQEELEEKRKQVLTLEDLRDDLRDQLASAKLELQRAQDNLALLETQRKEAGDKAKEKKEAQAQLKERLAALQADYNRMQLDNAQLTNRVESVRSDLEGKIEKAKKKAKKAKAAGAAFEKEVLALQTQNKVMEEQQHGLQAKIQTLEALVQASQKEAETKAALLEEANRQVAQLSQELTQQLSISGEMRRSSPASSSPPSPILSSSASHHSTSSGSPASTSPLMGASAVTIKHTHMLQEKLEKVENEFQEYVMAQAAKTDAAVSEWAKKVEKVREEKEAEAERLRREVDTWKERGLEAERKREAYEETNKQRELTLRQAESKIQKWKIIEQAANFRETEWEKLSRNVGSGGNETNMLTKFLLSCAENSLFPGHMLFHHIYYWRAIEMSNLPLLNAVAQTLHETLEMRQENLEEMAQLLACIGFLLYILYKSTNQNLEDVVKVPPLRSDQHISLSPKPDRSPKPVINTGNDFTEYLKVVVGKTFSCILRILAKRMSSVLEGLFLMESYKSMKVTKGAPQTSPLGVSEITTLLSDSAISLFQQAFISTSFSQQIFSKIFKYISGYLLNGMLLRQQFCSESFGIFLAPKIEALERWAKQDSIWVGDAYQELGPVKQAAAVLQLKDKSVLVDEKNRRNICPTLGPTQLRQLLAMYSPEEYGKKIPINVINAIPIPKTTGSQAILTELNEVSSFQVSTIHYLEVSDTFQLPIPFSLKAAIEKVCIPEEDMNGA
eukprot:Phypoly_transcript_00139.p1 GENE.Phypoly_transcript_00139~~Phypoly_transcript_00139.p1  ORF type:complete len:2086 (+),score=546.87 Phypoly_transcript_00139:143-6400(+)